MPPAETGGDGHGLGCIFLCLFGRVVFLYTLFNVQILHAESRQDGVVQCVVQGEIDINTLFLRDVFKAQASVLRLLSGIDLLAVIPRASGRFQRMERQVIQKYAPVVRTPAENGINAFKPSGKFRRGNGKILSACDVAVSNMRKLFYISVKPAAARKANIHLKGIDRIHILIRLYRADLNDFLMHFNARPARGRPHGIMVLVPFKIDNNVIHVFSPFNAHAFKAL